MKKVAIFLIAVALISGILGCSDGSHSNDYPDIPEDAVPAVDQTIGNIDVKYWERVVDGVFHVINDYVLLHLDPDTDEIIKYEQQWREIDVDLTGLEVKPFEPPGGEHFWKRLVVFLEAQDVGYFYTVSNTTQYPLVCWEARYSDGTTAMYDLSGNEIGCGIPAPYYSFLLSGYHNSASPDEWRRFRENASTWFQEWSDLTFSWSLPSPTIISEYVSDPGIQLYYAIAHGSSSRFQANSAGSYYRASDAEADMEDRDQMLFAFIGHCEGMTQTGSGSFSHAFRKGSMTNTVTVGYSGMGSSPGWPDALDWQDLMFQWMDEGYTVRDAFDLACAQYPLIAGDVVFCGDPELIVSRAIHFADSNLEAAIREAIGKPTGDIYSSDLAGLTSLDASERNIDDLTGLEYCTGLTTLNLNHNQVSDISPLVDNTGLGEGDYVDLRYNPLSDDSMNIYIPELEARGVSVYYDEEEEAVEFPDANLEAAIREAIGKPTGDIYPSDLAGLTSLSAYERNIADITGLEHCTSLTNLYIWTNQINNISPLTNLTNLTYVDLAANQISNISPVDNLTNVTYLYLWGNQISDISPLTNLTSLTVLYLNLNQINNISPLTNLTNLTKLELSYNEISDFSPLTNLTNLTGLGLGSNQISNVMPLASLTNLSRLGLSSNQINDISPLANLTNLTYLDLIGNQISNISALADLINLNWLYLEANYVSDISPLANLTNLSRLGLSLNLISDIAPLVDNIGLGEGDSVYLSNNPLSDTSINIYIPQLEARGVYVDYEDLGS